jgi:hypothetical protein
VAATKKSRARNGSPFEKYEIRSNRAASVKQTIGKSVSGGWNGFPVKPRTPWNRRPFRDNVGRIEKILGMTPPSFGCL